MEEGHLPTVKFRGTPCSYQLCCSNPQNRCSCYGKNPFFLFLSLLNCELRLVYTKITIFSYCDKNILHVFGKPSDCPLL